ncbi:ras-related protein RABA1f [Histomonas meleagridis]|uniref:ras-related protein RABA1f n=1 Tax=Histomonas meleagridis TaxID=135588 RepID=UPI003559DEBF|nr:ras-related protein RABA1f [Histomonas meleagridis]KAH0802387.1 ras-related protein RABA1f [Histomonas meleagridis]
MSQKVQLTTGILPPEGADPDYLIKIVLIGDSGVGKTNLLSQFARNKFVQDFKTTIGVEYATKTIGVEGKVVKVQIWDTAGQERYRAITSAYYKGAQGAMLLYDITSSITFESLDKWLKELRNQTGGDIPIMLVGNKCDLEDQRSVTTQEGINFAERENMLFIETSALTAHNVQEGFTRLISAIIQKIAQNEIEQIESTQLKPEGQAVKESKCC